MTTGAPDDAGIPERVAASITAAGNLGLTSAQLARTTGADPERLREALTILERDHRVTRVGHGLWLDRRLIDDPTKGLGYEDPTGFLDAFTQAHGIAGGDYRGEIQFRPNTEEPVHRWWPYVQGFSADFVRATLGRHRIGRGHTVLDPFAGSGTVPVVARELGAGSVGVELMPISAFVAGAKQRWRIDPATLQRVTARILRTAPRHELAPRPFLRETDRQFAPGPLDSLRRLRGTIDALDAPGEVAELVRLAFARILVDASRLRRSPCLGYGPKPPVARSGPFRMFDAAIGRIADDLVRLQADRRSWGPSAKILQEDSRRLSLPKGSVDLAVTSPPYVNGMDYVMNYKIELAWLGLVDSYDGLRALKNRMVACDNLPKSAAARGWGDAGLAGDPWMRGIVSAMRRNLQAKASYRRSDMDAVVTSYFADLRPTIAGVYDALRPGGRFVVVNGDSFLAGVYVPGDLIFGRMAVEAGFEVEGFETARVRRSGQRRDIRLRESILTLRRPG